MEYDIRVLFNSDKIKEKFASRLESSSRIVVLSNSSPFSNAYFSKVRISEASEFESIRRQLIKEDCSFLICEKLPDLEQPGVIFFDADMTLFQCEVIDEIAKYSEFAPEIQKITDLAMNGEIEFEEAFKKRISYLKGISVEKIQHLSNSVPISSGATELIRFFQNRDWKVVVISGGFTDIIHSALALRGIQPDEIFAHRLEVSDGTLTGKPVSEKIIGRGGKENIALSYAKERGIPKKQIIAVGDGYNDIGMLQTANAGFGFNPKEKLLEELQACIRNPNLTEIKKLLTN